MNRTPIRLAPAVPEPSRSTLERMREIAARHEIAFSPRDTQGQTFAERRRRLTLSIRLTDQFTTAELVHHAPDGDDLLLLLEESVGSDRWNLKRGATEDDRWDIVLPRRTTFAEGVFVRLSETADWNDIFAEMCRAFAVLANDP